MLSIYKQVLANKIIDSTTIADFNSELRTIERNYSIPPIGDMTDNECSRLEYQFVATYPKTLSKIYECYDKVLGLSIVELSLNDMIPAINTIGDVHSKSILMSILNVGSLYGVSAELVYGNLSAKHFLSRYVIINEMRPTTCCNIL